MTTETLTHICSVCEEPTDSVFYCDDCGDAFCESCAKIHLIEEGNGLDDINRICDICIREREGI